MKKGRIEQLQFKGDPMHRPVMSREVGFLVRWFVWLSEWLNSQLGLDRPAQQGETGENSFQVKHNLSSLQFLAHVPCVWGTSLVSPGWLGWGKHCLSWCAADWLAQQGEMSDISFQVCCNL